ncbi:GNAT family N-acetyltransferase [Bosea sp. (in: a-proteobacteria)]|uniref:GNAT family N-acetyltransferase n=1 Tax=Bosea sp. (in: a-proteobacteria) TaxID=1871050 RepID=UPI001D960C9F|nr:GNAT family N-acetyltransferase [Bosea sp. (in: a-proteobacteria)]MBA4224597.1 ribosomal-protein-alanine acetyltransferase [Methylobacterium sp.]MBR3190997.1 GNAT family N-acetyltransferase [Bosea sp. (in: a-proteobacteria)]
MDWFRSLFRRRPKAGRTGPLDVSHARQVAALHHQGGFARPWEPGECAALLADRAVVTDGIFIGRASEPCGFVMSRIAADEGEILSIVVAGGKRRSGLGQALLCAHLAQLAARGTARLFLEVEEGNAPAIGLYRRLGFDTVGRREGYYPKPDGSRVAALVMRRELG